MERHGAQPMAAIGKKGFQATVVRHWRGDRRRYLQFLQAKGLIVIDSFLANNAWQRPLPKPNDSQGSSTNCSENDDVYINILLLYITRRAEKGVNHIAIFRAFAPLAEAVKRLALL